MRVVVYILLLAAIFLASCDDDKREDDFNGIKFEQPGSLTINLMHVFNNQKLNTGKNYVTALNDTVNITEFKYYFSGIQLLTTTGNWVNLNNYNLINLDVPANHTITYSNIPANTYTKIKFIIGVDSIENFDGAQTGDLDPAYGMYWTWATGYVFFRFKGRYNDNNSLSLDLGGNNNLPKIELDLSRFKNKGSSIMLNTLVNVADVFVSPHQYKLSSTNDEIHTASHPSCPLLRDNIQTGVFTINSIQ